MQVNTYVRMASIYSQLKKKQKKYFFATEEVELKENLHASSPISQKGIS